MSIPYTVKLGDTLSSIAQFGIGRYFGAVGSLAKAQEAISPADKGESVKDYARMKT